jgi:hypothetical protein
MGDSHRWRDQANRKVSFKAQLSGIMCNFRRSHHLGGLSFLTPGDLHQVDKEDIDLNLLNLRPDPSHLVQFLKSIDRPEISSELFTRVLETYRSLKSKEESDPLRSVD